MKKILVPVTVVTFVHKDTGETFSVVGKNDNAVKGESFCGTIFGEDYDCTGLWKAISHVESLGHTVLTTNTTVEISIPK